jgi:hypothetical protein
MVLIVNSDMVLRVLDEYERVVAEIRNLHVMGTRRRRENGELEGMDEGDGPAEGEPDDDDGGEDTVDLRAWHSFTEHRARMQMNAAALLSTEAAFYRASHDLWIGTSPATTSRPGRRSGST